MEEVKQQEEGRRFSWVRFEAKGILVEMRHFSKWQRCQVILPWWLMGSWAEEL